MKLLRTRIMGYFSTIFFLNILYIFKKINNKNIMFIFADNRHWTLPYYCDIVIMVILAIEIILGVIFFIAMLFTSDKIKEKNTKGKNIELINLNNITQQEYFGKYSLLILTGLTLPTDSSIIAILIFIIIQLSLGVIFIYYNLIYINPLLLIFKFQVYFCDDKNSKIVIITKENLNGKSSIKINNTNRKIIKY